MLNYLLSDMLELARPVIHLIKGGQHDLLAEAHARRPRGSPWALHAAHGDACLLGDLRLEFARRARDPEVVCQGLCLIGVSFDCDDARCGGVAGDEFFG